MPTPEREALAELVAAIYARHAAVSGNDDSQVPSTVAEFWRKVEKARAALSAPAPQVLPSGFVIFDALSGCKAGQLTEDLPLGTQLYTRAVLQGATASSTEGASK